MVTLDSRTIVARSSGACSSGPEAITEVARVQRAPLMPYVCAGIHAGVARTSMASSPARTSKHDSMVSIAPAEKPPWSWTSPFGLAPVPVPEVYIII